MADLRALILEKLLRGCESTDAALVTRQSLPPTDKLPERLEQFLDGYIKREDLPAQDVMSATMQDFGSRVFRRLLSAGNRKKADTDLTQNSHDVRAAGDLLRGLAVECQNTPFVPPGVAGLLARGANALWDFTPFRLLHERQRRRIARDCAAAGLTKSQTAKIQNTFDLLAAIGLLMALKEQVGAAAPLLSRVISALHDVSAGAHPALFDIEPQVAQSLLRGEEHAEIGAPSGKPTGFTTAAAAEGGLAVVWELLSSAMPKADAEKWLDREIAEHRLLDREGNAVAASQIMKWRKNFRVGTGAALGRRMYDLGCDEHRALIRAPKSDLKRCRVEEAARRLLRSLTMSARGEMAIPQRRRAKNQRAAPAKKG